MLEIRDYREETCNAGENVGGRCGKPSEMAMVVECPGEPVLRLLEVAGIRG